MAERIFGLDLLRATAILLVLFNHIVNYFVPFDLTVLGDISGILGVELFFVLSGFLIGRIILREIHSASTIHTLRRFYLRRWFRTLPLYYFLLIFLACIALFVIKQQGVSVFHFLFLQNFFPDSLAFFSVSWSLAIEEWFYLLLPLVMIWGYKQAFFSRRMLFFLLTLIFFLIITRFFFVIFFDPTFEEIHKHLFFRFDSLLIGVFLAGIKVYKAEWYNDLQKPSRIIIPLFFIAILCFSYAKYYLRDALDASLAIRVVGFPLVSFFIAMLIPFLENSVLINKDRFALGKIGRIITTISLLSYSLYLVHLSVFDGVKGFFLEKIPLLVMLPIALFLTVIISYTLYRFIEQPFMQMREKFH